MLLQLMKQVWGGRFKKAWAVEAFLPAARTAFEQNDLAATEQAIDALLATDPDHPEALYYRGLVAYRRHDLPAAMTAFHTAAERAPDNGEYLFQVAFCHVQLGNLAQAKQACESAMAAHPYDPRPYSLMAQLNFPGPSYTDILAGIHRRLAPRTYLEIGVETGRTLALAAASTMAIGVDPMPKIEHPLGPNARVYALTSDDFFSSVDVAAQFCGLPVDLAFIDGMHQFEFALRDFAAVERYCTPRSTILIHDCYPLDRRSAERERVTTFWSGDVWRLVPALKKYRPDLAIRTVATAPTGLTVVRQLDPSSRVIAEHMNDIVSEFLAVDYAMLDDDKPGKLNLTPNEWGQIERFLV